MAERTMQGVWKARYGGPHGMEYIQVSMAGEATPPPAGCPVTWERLEGFKVPARAAAVAA